METNSGPKHQEDENAPAKQKDIIGGGTTSGGKGTTNYGPEPIPASDDDSQGGGGSSSGSKGTQSYPGYGK